MNKPIILTFVDSYLPGYKYGGPVRTVSNMVECLGDEFDFRIITSDREFGDATPYADVITDAWNTVGKASVYYVSPRNRSLLSFGRLIKNTPHDALYLNSFFSPGFTICPLLARYFGLTPGCPIIIAPRGEFAEGALALKGRKKRLYIMAAKALGLYRGVIWQASSRYERDDIMKIFPRQKLEAEDSRIVIAPNLLQACKISEKQLKEPKKEGVLRIVFISRISPKKNLDGALTILQGIKGEITFDIYGPLEDEVYWEKCGNVIKSLPASARVRYNGVVPHDRVAETFNHYDLFFFPTHGENFGHVIIEALVSGCPVLISDQTPWRDLAAAGAGWDIPLGLPERMAEVLQQCVDMDDSMMRRMSASAMEYGVRKVMDAGPLRQNRDLFNSIYNY